MAMGNVTIRRLDDDAKRNARLAAAANGRSLEAELRDLIERTYAKPGEAGRFARIQAMSAEEWVEELVRLADGTGEGVFDPEPQPLREFDL
jgi:plasmid stability protein